MCVCVSVYILYICIRSISIIMIILLLLLLNKCVKMTKKHYCNLKCHFKKSDQGLHNLAKKCCGYISKYGYKI